MSFTESISLDLILAFSASFAICLAIIPALKKVAKPLGLVDEPSRRKVHKNPIPVIGGLAIGISLILSLSLSAVLWTALLKYMILLTAGFVLMLVGIIDDRLDLKPIHRLCIQIICAYAVAASGIRITSLHGIIGIDALGNFASYAFTIFLIAGVVNAFNLVDGIDGLAGLLSLFSIVVLGSVAIMVEDLTLTIILMTLAGTVLGFLGHNLSKKKIFLGDGGSLFLGFILVVVGIHLIQLSAENPFVDVHATLSKVFGVFLIPVLDSLRVYWGRISSGHSPFKADKSHLHHLFIFFKVTHKKASLAILGSSLFLTGLMSWFYKAYGLSSSLMVASMLFILLTWIFSASKNLGEWKARIGELEFRD